MMERAQNNAVTGPARRRNDRFHAGRSRRALGRRVSVRLPVVTLVGVIAFSATALAADQRTIELPQGKARFAVPADWVDFPSESGEDFAAIVFQIKNPADEGTSHSANCGVSLRVDRATSAENFANAWIARRQKVAGATLVSRFDRGAPLSDVFAFYRWQQESVPYVAVDRYSKRGDVLVQISVAWPLLPATTAEWSNKMTDDTNRLLSNLSISGKPLGPLAVLRWTTLQDGDKLVRILEAVKE